MSNQTNISILGVRIYDRIKEAGEVQQVLTKHGCSIKTRLGLHEVTDEYCSKSGLIILELFGDTKKQTELEQELIVIDGVEVQKMLFKN